MLTKEQLEAEHGELCQQLEYIEGILKSRFGWKKPSVTVDFAMPPESGDFAEGESLAYNDLAREWLKAQPESKSLTAGQYREWLEGKFGDRVNRNSTSGPLRQLVKDGLLKVIRVGRGKRPTIYRKAKEAVAV